MVLVDGVKYACQQCIKGHRSSKCTHSTRPLTEIRKKGRPATQCAHCKELRKTRSVHTRCDCVAREAQQEHVARVLPNGIADVIGQAASTEEAPLTRTEPSGVTRLLNPCSCLRGGKCTCCESIKKPTAKFLFPDDPSPTPPASSVASTSTGGCCSSSSNLVAVEIVSPLSERGGSGNGYATMPGGDILVNGTPTPASTSSPYPLPSTPAPLLYPQHMYPSTSYDSLSTSSALPTPPAFASAPQQPAPVPPSLALASNPLFLPPTVGTLACFCGPTCQCVGCATHDPQSRKRPAPGACSGGGCRCGTGRGCEEGGGGSKKSRRSSSAGGCCAPAKEKGSTRLDEQAPTKASCCGSKSASSASSSSSSSDYLPLLSGPPPGSAGIALPSLWSPSLESATIASAPPDSKVGPGTLPPPSTTTTSAPLPSLRTLWPALLDLDPATDEAASSIDPGTGTGTTSMQAEGGESAPDPYAHHCLPEGLLDPSLEPAILRAPPSSSNRPEHITAGEKEDKLVLTACSAVFLEEPLDDRCGSGGEEGEDEGCLCTSACGCRGGGGGDLGEDEKEEGVAAANGWSEG
ncbi:hypothetical protein JCM10908_000971 [Rhodotorula pacifica]|uniref:copper fist DNA-binding domain-containing protein n=1 Tax=Rhodotorula pacifica TaxID=1495444 RepID=UPI0031829191